MNADDDKLIAAFRSFVAAAGDEENYVLIRVSMLTGALRRIDELEAHRSPPADVVPMTGAQFVESMQAVIETPRTEEEIADIIASMETR